jgi:hypothetical protein
MMTIQKKTRPYAKWVVGDDFNPLAIEMYECLHFRFDSFFIACAQTTIMCQIMVLFNPLNVFFTINNVCP